MNASMMKTGLKCVFVLLLLTTAKAADDEITLFNGDGKPVAYVAVDEDLTIYLWSGKPVAYLDPDSDGGFHIYGSMANTLAGL